MNHILLERAKCHRKARNGVFVIPRFDQGHSVVVLSDSMFVAIHGGKLSVFIWSLLLQICTFVLLILRIIFFVASSNMSGLFSRNKRASTSGRNPKRATCAEKPLGID